MANALHRHRRKSEHTLLSYTHALDSTLVPSFGGLKICGYTHETTVTILRCPYLCVHNTQVRPFTAPKTVN